MNQLLLGEVLKIARQLKKSGFTQKEINELPIYIGNDDELNGIHTAWYVDFISPEDKDNKDFKELINEDPGNIEFIKNSILIS